MRPPPPVGPPPMTPAPPQYPPPRLITREEWEESREYHLNRDEADSAGEANMRVSLDRIALDCFLAGWDAARLTSSSPTPAHPL